MTRALKEEGGPVFQELWNGGQSSNPFRKKKNGCPLGKALGGRKRKSVFEVNGKADSVPAYGGRTIPEVGEVVENGRQHTSPKIGFL